MYACVRCFGLYYLSYGIVDTWRLIAAYTLRAKLVFCLVELKACMPKLCVLLYSAMLSCVAACLACHCSKLRFVNLISIKAYYYYYYYYYYSVCARRK